MQTWQELLKEQKASPHFQAALNFVARQEAEGKTVFPPRDKIFEAFRLTDFESLKVVILGQDPYHGPNQAHGLCFSVQPGVPIPPSLKNIYKEMHSDLGIAHANHGHLTHWAEQGVFLLNTVLTVNQGDANSHRGQGWETFTDTVIQIISEQKEHVVFLLWGAPAQKKAALIDDSKHSILRAPHPSPLSAHRGFLGCQHFSKANDCLKQHGQEPIDWQLPPYQ